MLKTKYRFNPESLSFDKIRLGFKAILLRSLAYFTGSLFIAVIYSFIFTFLVDTPKEKALKREIAQMTIRYEMTNTEMANIEKVLQQLQETDEDLYRTIFEAEPIPASLREAGTGGVSRYNDLEGYDNSEIVIETAKKLDKIRKKIYIQSKSFDELIVLAERKEEMLGAIPAILPIYNIDLTRTASGYGLRMHPIYKIIKFHSGMDFTAPTGTEVYATGNGVIDAVSRSKRGYGNHIIVDHGFGYSSMYAHLDDFNVKKGQKVRRGDIIGYVGSTGTSLAPHLHYEVKLNGENVDPVNFYFNDLTPDMYDRIIEIASKTGQSFD